MAADVTAMRGRRRRPLLPEAWRRRTTFTVSRAAPAAAAAFPAVILASVSYATPRSGRQPRLLYVHRGGGCGGTVVYCKISAGQTMKNEG